MRYSAEDEADSRRARKKADSASASASESVAEASTENPSAAEALDDDAETSAEDDDDDDECGTIGNRWTGAAGDTDVSSGMKSGCKCSANGSWTEAKADDETEGSSGATRIRRAFLSRSRMT